MLSHPHTVPVHRGVEREGEDAGSSWIWSLGGDDVLAILWISSQAYSIFIAELFCGACVHTGRADLTGLFGALAELAAVGLAFCVTTVTVRDAGFYK